MNEISVSSIRIPGSPTRLRGTPLSKRAFISVLRHIQIGSLTIHEGDETLHFGDTAADTDLHAVVNVQDPRAYQQILTGGTVGAGESYMLGHWQSPDLVKVIRVMCANMAVMDGMDSRKSLLRRLGLRIAHTLKGNSLKGSRRNISAHYDLGNDFFRLFLDSTMMYSSAVFPRPNSSLEVASAHKLDLICKQLQLTADDHLLEIGTGWGGLAIHAARRYGCQVTTTTLSREQYEYASQRVMEEGLEDRITLLCKDYRELTGSYDKLVSIEMIEAVGYEYYQNYFTKCSSLLKPEGLMVIQAITMADQRYENYKRSVDFIKHYIFPGGCLPSLEVISHHLSHDTDMQMIHLRDITQDYALTLAAWRERFVKALPEIRAQGFDEMFERMWEFYLCYCEGGFRERVIGTVQLTFAKPGYRPVN